jgi:hypothetical protein
MVRQLNAHELTFYVLSLLESTDRSLRSKLDSFAKDHGILMPE